MDVAVFELEDWVMEEERVWLVADEWETKRGILEDAEDVVPLPKLVLFLLALDDDDPSFRGRVGSWHQLREARGFDLLDTLPFKTSEWNVIPASRGR